MAGKKRKATYLVVKEQQEALQDEIEALQQQLQALQDEGDGGAAQRRDLYASVATNMALCEDVEQQHIRIAGMQGLVSEYMQSKGKDVMGMRIHLGREWAARRETLLAMKDERLARGFRYVMARYQHVQPLKPQFSEERFEEDNGDFCCVCSQVIPFPGVQNLRKVFDAVRFTVDTLEIAISEQLGHTTLRDDYDDVEAGAFVSNYRLSSGLDCGVTAELNAVAFGQYVEKEGEQPYGIMAIDSVDVDELHPYHPNECVRKVLHGTVLLLPVRRKKKGSSEDEVVVVMLRSFFVKTCRPQFDVSELAMQELRDNVTRWGDVVLQAIRRMIYT